MFFMKKGCLILVLLLGVLMVIGVVSVVLSPSQEGAETTTPPAVESSDEERLRTDPAPATGPGLSEENSTAETDSTGEAEDRTPSQTQITFFADTPKEAVKDKLTIDDQTMEGITKVRLVEGEGVPVVSIMHSSGVKAVKPQQVPLAFAVLWDYSDDDVTELIAEIKTRQEARKKAIAARNKAIADKKKAEQDALIAKVGPEPKASAWDGSVLCVKNYLKSAAHDPESLKFDTWFKPMLVETESGPAWRVKVIYRAKNSFGATVKEVGYGFVRHGSVVAFETE